MIRTLSTFAIAVVAVTTTATTPSLAGPVVDGCDNVPKRTPGRPEKALQYDGFATVKPAFTTKNAEIAVFSCTFNNERFLAYSARLMSVECGPSKSVDKDPACQDFRPHTVRVDTGPQTDGPTVVKIQWEFPLGSPIKGKEIVVRYNVRFSGPKPKK